MGGCFSDVMGGQQAIGVSSNSANNGYNDAVDFFYRARGLQPLFTQLELSLSATKLLDRDVLSKSDPMVVVSMKRSNGRLEELGRTEVIMNNLSPSWIRKIPVVYNFEIVQPLVFQIYDVDTKYNNTPVKELNLSHQDFLGEATCFLSEVVTKQNQSLTLSISNKSWFGDPNSLGTLTIHAEESAASRSAVNIVFRCAHLENADLFSKSDPFLRISRIVEAGGCVPICKTEVIKNNLNPVWRPVCLTMQQFGSKDNPLIIECFDFNNSGNHTLLGQLQISISALQKLHKDKASVNFVRLHHGHQKVLKGQLFVDVFREEQLYSFLDYISSGFELNFMVAIDFTASNGNPRSPDSLHYIDPSGRLNAYQRAIVEVGEVIQFYDSDRRFSAWGFGGRTMDGNISHCFNLNGKPYDSEVEGVEGVMAAYDTTLRSVALAGPTLFGRVIHQAADIASESLSQNKSKYYILLIITDGVVTDLQESIDTIVKASDLPLSILIVGVGNADFTAMEILDADTGRGLVSSTGRQATRDIVQFVPMREVQAGAKPMVQSLLEELPGQFIAFMRSKDIKPPNANPNNVFSFS